MWDGGGGGGGERRQLLFFLTVVWNCDRPPPPPPVSKDHGTENRSVYFWPSLWESIFPKNFQEIALYGRDFTRWVVNFHSTARSYRIEWNSTQRVKSPHSIDGVNYSLDFFIFPKFDWPFDPLCSDFSVKVLVNPHCPRSRMPHSCMWIADTPHTHTQTCAHKLAIVELIPYGPQKLKFNVQYTSQIVFSFVIF